MLFEFVVAVDENMGMGKNGKIPWYCPDDLKNFKAITSGSHVVMGYNSYKDIFDNYYSKRKDVQPILNIPGVSLPPLLPGRTTLVLTTKHSDLPGAEACYQSIEQMKTANSILVGTVFVVGGGQVFDTFLQTEKIQRIHLSVIKGMYNCDVKFPASIKVDLEQDTCTVVTKTNKHIPYHFGGYGIQHDQFNYGILELIEKNNGAI